MTLPYGSTRLTCRESVIDYIVDLEEKRHNELLQKGGRRILFTLLIMTAKIT